jgi:hypothetical protein
MHDTLLICGDSFAADWTVKYPGWGWPNRLTECFDVTNLAQPGCGQYKIYQQLLSVDINKFSTILVSHTSPNRIYVRTHPVHHNDVLHKNSDLIYTDILEHAKNDKSLSSIVDYYENYFDLEYAKFVHSMTCEKIQNLLTTATGKILHVAHSPWDNLHQFDNMINFEWVFKKHNGFMNHYTDRGNKIIYDLIVEKIQGNGHDKDIT